MLEENLMEGAWFWKAPIGQPQDGKVRIGSLVPRPNPPRMSWVGSGHVTRGLVTVVYILMWISCK